MKEDSNSISIIDYSNFGQIWSLQISRPILEPFWREPNIFASMEFKKLGCFIHGVKVIFHDHMTIQNLKSSMSQYTIYITCTWYWNIELNQSMAWPCMKMIKEREKNKQILAPTRLLPPKLVSWTTSAPPFTPPNHVPTSVTTSHIYPNYIRNACFLTNPISIR